MSNLNQNGEIDINLSDVEESPKSSKYILALFDVDVNITDNVGFFYKFIEFEKGSLKNLTNAAIKKIEYLDPDIKRLEHFNSSKQGSNIYIYYLNKCEKFLLEKDKDLKITTLEEFYDRFKISENYKLKLTNKIGELKQEYFDNLVNSKKRKHDKIENAYKDMVQRVMRKIRTEYPKIDLNYQFRIEMKRKEGPFIFGFIGGSGV
ncbi:12161_t:CDS:1, partial [Dentiscutata heterogama]